MVASAASSQRGCAEVPRDEETVIRKKRRPERYEAEEAVTVERVQNISRCLIAVTLLECKCSFIDSGHFNSASSSPLLLRGAPDYSTDTVLEFHAEAHRQLQVKDLPKVPMWWLEWESNPKPSG